MRKPAKSKASDAYPLARGVRWKPDEWARIQEAVAALAARHQVRATAADVIRSGTLRRVEEILGAA